MLKMLLHLAFISVQEFPLVLGHFSEISPEFRSGPAEASKVRSGSSLVTGDVIMTKLNRVHAYLQRNNPVKFHRYRIRFSRVMMFTSSVAILREITSL